MALSDTTIVDIELTDTFEAWRLTTNRIITLINESADDNPFTSIITANSEGGFQINSVQTNSLSVLEATGSNLVFTGATAYINFTGANTTSLGNVHQTHILGGTQISGSNPSSSISNTQINNSEINLNGQNLKANGSSTITLTGATVADLGVVNFLKVIPDDVGESGGLLAGINVVSNSSYVSNLRLNAGNHTFLGSLVDGGEFVTISLSNSAIHSTNITMNAASTLVSNGGAIFGSDLTNSNVAIGNFPEWNGTSNRKPTSSRGRLHIRSDFVKEDGGSPSAVSPNEKGSELIIEGNTSVGMTLLANSASNSHIFFGDESDTDNGFIVYDNSNDHLVFGNDESAEKFRIQKDYGGSVQIAGANTFESPLGKLHINQTATDGADALYIGTSDGDKRAINLAIGQETMNAVEMATTSLTTGTMMSMRYEPSTTAFEGSMLDISDNNQHNGIRKVMSLVQEHADGTGTTLLYGRSDGGQLFDLIQNAPDKKSISLVANTTTSNVSEYFMDKLTTGTGFHISSDSDNHTSNLFSIITNSTSATATTLSIKNISATNQNLVSIANSSSSVFITETGGNIGINNNGQTVKILASNGSLTTATATTPLHKLHLHGTLGVENESIFNADMRVNANVTIQNGPDSMLILDSPDVGSATFAIGENADTSGHQAFYITYPAGDGYTYLGMGAIQPDLLPLNYSLKFNGFNNDLYSPGNFTLAQDLNVTGQFGLNGNITSNGTITMKGNSYLASNTVIIETNEGVGNTTIDDVLTTTGNTNIQGQLNVETANTRLGSNLTVHGNTALREHLTTTNTATFSNTVTIEGDTTINGDIVTLTGSNVFISDSSSITTIKGELNVDNKMVVNSSNIYFSDSSGRFVVKGASALNDLEVSGATIMADMNLSGGLTVGGDASFASAITASNATSNNRIVGMLNVSGNTKLATDVITVTKVGSTRSTAISGPVYVGGTTTIAGQLTQQDTATFKKDTTLEKNLTVNQSATIDQNLTVKGTINVSDGDIIGGDDITVAGNMTVNGTNVYFGSTSSNVACMSNLHVQNDLNVQGAININGGDITASDDLVVAGTVDVLGVSRLSQITANGQLTHTGSQAAFGDGTLSVSKVGASRTVGVVGNQNISGNLTVGGQMQMEDVSADTMSINSLSISQAFTSTGTATFGLNGLSTTGNITTTTNNINANGVKCRLPVYGADSTLLNPA